MPALRVDWQKIRDGIETNGLSVDSPFVFVLPHAGRHLLMSVIDILKYQATYRINGYPYDDWDSLLSLVELTHYGLMEGEQVGEIGDAIRYLADKLSENFPNVGTNIIFPETGTGGSGEDMSVTVNNNNCNCGCGCNGSGGGGYEEPPELTNPDDFPDVPPPFEDDNYNPLPQNALMCEVTHGMLMDWRNLTLAIVEGNLRIGDLYQRLGRIYYGTVPYLSSMTAVLILWQWFFSYTGSDKSRIATEIDRNYDKLQCAILKGGGTKAINDRLKAIMRAMDLGLYLRYQMQGTITNIPWEQVFTENGQSSLHARIGDGFEARGCPNCAGGIETPAPYEENGFKYVWVVPDVSKIVFSSANKTVGTYDGQGKIVVTRTSDSSYDHNINYEFLNIAPSVDSVMVASEVETLAFHPITQWGTSSIGSYAGNSSKSCDANILQKRIQLPTGEWQEGSKLRTWADTYYPGKVDTQIPSISPKGYPSFIQPNAIPLEFKVRYLYKVPL